MGTNFANRTLFHGDNLGFLQGLDSGSVHLIATDPPFNKGRDFHSTPDSLAAGGKFEDRWSRDDVHDEWIEAIKDFDAQRKRTKRKGEYQQELGGVWTAIEAADTTWGKDMGAFLCYMGVRLLEMRRVLHENGSLYLHCDPTASHYLKIMLDAIFGRRNFRNEIIWERVKEKGRPVSTVIANSAVPAIRFCSTRSRTITPSIWRTCSVLVLKRKSKRSSPMSTTRGDMPTRHRSGHHHWENARICAMNTEEFLPLIRPDGQSARSAWRKLTGLAI